MMLEKKQICTIFLFEFKMGYKVAETTHNINNAFDLETANEHPVQRTFKKLQIACMTGLKHTCRGAVKRSQISE